jgi:protein-L-isoaspartate(D-aspartate) O-methyltransferase
VLSNLGASVVALEQDAALARSAKAALDAAGARQVRFVEGSLTSGSPADAPFDVILFEGATEVVPNELGVQLKPQGRLAAVFGSGPAGKAMIYRRIEDQLVGRPVFDAGAPVLPGFAALPAFVF